MDIDTLFAIFSNDILNIIELSQHEIISQILTSDQELVIEEVVRIKLIELGYTVMNRIIAFQEQCINNHNQEEDELKKANIELEKKVSLLKMKLLMSKVTTYIDKMQSEDNEKNN